MPIMEESSMPNKLKKQERQTMLWESEDCIVPMKSAFQADGKKLGNASEGKAVGPIRVSNQASAIHSDGTPLLNRLERITKRADADKAARFNNLYSALTYELLYDAFCRLKRGKAPGIDGVTLEEYGLNLIANLRSLVDQLHRQSYLPQPSLRRLIPKGNGKTRPLGIACVEDKIVQRAVVMILERIYEVDFIDTSYGFRPDRSCHQALARLGGIVATKKVNWISDADIKGFFDNVSHSSLLELLKRRIEDPRMLWLMKYREVARRFGLRWLRRRSQKGSAWSWDKYCSYLEHHSLAVPKQITDLIALSRQS
jgi:hypothetical protein